MKNNRLLTGKSDGSNKAMSQYHAPWVSRCLTDMSLFAVQLPSLPEAAQGEDKPAAEEEASEEQGEDLKVENIAVRLFLSADM